MSVIEEIKDKLDMLDVVGLKMEKSGRAYETKCPFHQENTPSFKVFPETQTWRCFGACNEGGDIFSYVMKRDNCDFKTALETLAKQAGVEIEQTAEQVKAYARHVEIKEILTFATEFYYKQLLDTFHAMELELSKLQMLEQQTNEQHEQQVELQKKYIALVKRGQRGLPLEVLHRLKWGFSRGDGSLQMAMANKRPELIKPAKEYGILSANGNDFVSFANGNGVSPDGWIIYPHFEHGDLNGQVVYLSSRAVSDTENGKDKCRNLVSRIPPVPYMVLIDRRLSTCSSRPEHVEGHLKPEIILTEGPSDAASVFSLGYPSVALLKQSFNADYVWLLNRLRKHITRKQRVIVALSHDTAGIQGAVGTWEGDDRKPGVCETIHPLTEILLWPKDPNEKKSDANSWLNKGHFDLAELLKSTLVYLDKEVIEAAKIKGRGQTTYIKFLASLVARLSENERKDYTRMITETKIVKQREFEQYIQKAMTLSNDEEVEILDDCFAYYGEKLTNCIFWIKQQQYVKSRSVDSLIRYTIEGRNSTKKLRPITIESTELIDFDKWMARAWGIDGMALVGRNDFPKLREILARYSKPKMKYEEVYSYTGYETINGKPGFLTNSGLLTANGLDESVKVELDGAFKLFRLPPPPDEVAVGEAIKASLTALELAPAHLIVPLYLAQFVAALNPFQTLNSTIVLLAPSQTGKSTLAHDLVHFGDFKRGALKHDYVSIIDAASTNMMIQQYNHELADMVSIIDDIPPGGNPRKKAEQMDKFDLVTRAMGNRAARKRSGYADADPLVGICIITLEKIPTNVGSIRNRSIVLEFNNKDIDMTKLTQYQQYESNLNTACMSAFIQWVLQNWTDLETLIPAMAIKVQTEDLVEKHLENGKEITINRYKSKRLYDYYATLMVAGLVLLRFAIEKEAITKDQKGEYEAMFRQALIDCMDYQDENISEMEFSLRFFKAIEEITAKHRYAIIPATGRPYKDEQSGEMLITFEHSPSTPAIGWVIEENGKKEIYFNDVEALKAVRSHLRDTSGDYLDVDNVTLRKEFNHLGILLGTSTEGEGKRQKIRYTARRDWPNGQKNMRILVLNPAIVKEKLKVDLLREDEPFKEESPEGV